MVSLAASSGLNMCKQALPANLAGTMLHCQSVHACKQVWTAGTIHHVDSAQHLQIKTPASKLLPPSPWTDGVSGLDITDAP